MKCEQCGAALDAFSLTKVGKKYDMRCEKCRHTQQEQVTKADRKQQNHEAVGEGEVTFEYYITEAVGVKVGLKEFQGHTWYGDTKEQALANVRSFFARKYKGEVTINEGD